jgi:hypothetical protein
LRLQLSFNVLRTAVCVCTERPVLDSEKHLSRVTGVAGVYGRNDPREPDVLRGFLWEPNFLPLSYEVPILKSYYFLIMRGLRK